MTFRVVVTDGVSAKGLEPLSRDDRFEVLAIPTRIPTTLPKRY